MNSYFTSLKDYEQKAQTILPKNAFDYFRSGAGDETTLHRNCSDFKNFRIRPRVLRDVSKRDLSVEIFGSKVSAPLGISPTAMQRMAHPEGEIATAKAAAKENIIYILSTLSTSSIEEVTSSTENSTKWFQLYIYKDRELTENIIRRAENSNFKALVLTVDAPVFGLRRADMKNKFALPNHLRLANFSDSIVSEGGSGINEYVSKQFDSSISWSDVSWLIKFSKLPVILKGIMTKEDASLAIKIGASGIIVSNHGARQVDNVASSIEALAEIVKKVSGRIPIMFDGGIREGTDIFVALGLGAKMVFIGRPVVYGLACEGETGVENVIKILKNEFDIAMCNCGVSKPSEILREMVVHKSFYANL